MGTLMTAEAARLAFGELAASTTPAGLAQFKIDRLHELRAVIDSLRREHRQDASPEWSNGHRPNAAR